MTFTIFSLPNSSVALNALYIYVPDFEVVVFLSIYARK